MSEPRLEEGHLVLECRHGFTAWQACGTCCMNLADMVAPLMSQLAICKDERNRAFAEIRKQVHSSKVVFDEGIVRMAKRRK